MRYRLVTWALVVVLFLMIPLLMMVIGVEGWQWTPFDFVVMGSLLFATAFAYEATTRNVRSLTKRCLIGLCLFLLLMIVWVEGAVGIL